MTIAQLKELYNGKFPVTDAVPTWEGVFDLIGIANQLNLLGVPTPSGYGHWWLEETGEQIAYRIETFDLYCDYHALLYLTPEEITPLQRIEAEVLAVELRRRGVDIDPKPTETLTFYVDADTGELLHEAWE